MTKNQLQLQGIIDNLESVKIKFCENKGILKKIVRKGVLDQKFYAKYFEDFVNYG